MMRASTGGVTFVKKLAFFLALVMGGLTGGGLVAGQEIRFKWITQFGTPGMDVIRGTAIHRGRIYVAGETTGSLPDQTSAGGRDAFLREYKRNGTVVWTRQFGSTGNEFVGSIAGGVALEDKSIYVVGRTTGTLPGQTSAGGLDAFVRKYDIDGTLLWTHQFGTAGLDDLHDVTVDEGGRIFVVGSTDGTLPGQTSSGGFDAVVRRYDPNGTVVWTRQFGTSAVDHLDAVTVDDDGGVYVTGFTGGALPGQINEGGFDVVVRKYDSNGDVVWTRQFGTAANDGALGIAVEEDVGVYVDGGTDGTLPGQTSAGGRDVFVRKYSLNGTLMWTRQFGTPGFDEPSVVAVAGGAVFVDGVVSGALPGQTYAGGSPFGFDAFVRKYDTFGFEIWTLQFGTSGDDDPRGMAVDADNIFVGGVTNGSLPGHTNAGGNDAFLIRLNDDEEDDG